jgi:hypothetical protein
MDKKLRDVERLPEAEARKVLGEEGETSGEIFEDEE